MMYTVNSLRYGKYEIFNDDRNNCGIKDDKGNILVPNRYSDLGFVQGEEFLDNGYIYARKGFKHGVITLGDDIVVPFVHDNEFEAQYALEKILRAWDIV